MKSDLLSQIKAKHKPSELFLMSELIDKEEEEAAVREELLRLTKDGSLKRFSYGIYYIPGKTEPSAMEAIELRYIGNDKNIYGFYTGDNYLASILGRKISVNDKIEIMTNRATSGKKTIYMFSKRFTLRKPYIEITKANDKFNAFLSYIAMTPLAEIRRNSPILATYIRKEHFSADDFMEMAQLFPGKTASKLIASDLYRSLWKH